MHKKMLGFSNKVEHEPMLINSFSMIDSTVIVSGGKLQTAQRTSSKVQFNLTSISLDWVAHEETRTDLQV